MDIPSQDFSVPHVRVPSSRMARLVAIPLLGLALTGCDTMDMGGVLNSVVSGMGVGDPMAGAGGMNPGGVAGGDPAVAQILGAVLGGGAVPPAQGQQGAVQTASAAPAQRASAPAAKPAAKAPSIGCAKVQGRFATSDGRSNVTLKTNGVGSMSQKIESDGETFLFETDFRWTGSQSQIEFDYLGDGIFRDPDTKEVVHNTKMEKETSKCSYNGKELVLDGVAYRKRG